MAGDRRLTTQWRDDQWKIAAGAFSLLSEKQRCFLFLPTSRRTRRGEMHALAACVVAPAPGHLTVPLSSRCVTPKRTSGVFSRRNTAKRTPTCMAGGGRNEFESRPDRGQGVDMRSMREDGYDERGYVPDEYTRSRRGGERSPQNDQYDRALEQDTFARDEEKQWRAAFTDRRVEKQQRWNEWDLAAAEENALRQEKARDRLQNKPQRNVTPEQRRERLVKYRTLSKAADTAFEGQVARRRDARENGIDYAARGDDWYRDEFGGNDGRYPNEPRRDRDRDRASRRLGSSLSVDSLGDWLFTPLTKTANGVNNWLNEDISVTGGRRYDGRRDDSRNGYDGRNGGFDDGRDTFAPRDSYRRDEYEYEPPRQRSPKTQYPPEKTRVPSEFDGRRAWDAKMRRRRTRLNDDNDDTFYEPRGNDRDDRDEGNERDEYFPPRETRPRRDRGESDGTDEGIFLRDRYDRNGDRDRDERDRDFDDSRRRKKDVPSGPRGWFRDLGDQLAPKTRDDTPIDAIEFDRLRNRR